MSHPPSIKVLFIASEADPFIKVGGLADVAGSLPRALKKIGLSDVPEGPNIDIRLVIPDHPQIQRDLYSPRLIAKYPIRTEETDLLVDVHSFSYEGLPVYLVGGDPIKQESGVYSANLEADGYKYVFFSLACLELARQLEWKPDILHANDWHTATAVYSLAHHRTSKQFLHDTKSLLTIHNLPYLGSMTARALETFRVPPTEDPDLPPWARQMALPLGLLAADRIVAVSPGYAKEIMTEEFGSGLEDFLSFHAAKISGILNGLDTQKWDPTNDKYLAANYSYNNLHARMANKTHLQKETGLVTNPRIPLLAMVTRMDPQKGVDLAVSALHSLLQSANRQSSPVQMIFLGTGNPVLENEVRQLEHDFPESVRAQILFSEQLSHQIYAGADILLMPSRYEPCGLSQMIAMRYGCVPIARATGGLCDTIQDPKATEQSTGFLFTPAKSEALEATIHRALAVYNQKPTAWQAIQQRGMLRDFSWACSAREYIKEYISLMGMGK